MAIGSLLGGAAGAAIGSAVPGLGTAAGYAVGTGIGGGIEGLIQENKANDMPLIGSTPMQITLLDEMRSKRKALEAGVMYQPQQENIRQTGTQAQRNAVKVAGGDTGATISALNKINRGTGRSLNELYGQMMNQSNQMQALEGQQVNLMSKADMEVANYKKFQMTADAMKKQKDAMGIIAGIVGQKFAGMGLDEETQANYMQKIMEMFAKMSSAANPLYNTNQ